VNEHDGDLDGSGRRFAIVVSRFNSLVTRQLLGGARDCLLRHGVEDDAIDVFHVPGAWEIPQAAQRVLKSGGHDALVALGCVIRGATPHFDYVAGEAARGLGAIAREARVPVVFGVLTTDTVEQALERAGTKAGNKGWDAALSALELVNLFGRIG
jgi:6,7-dimethyl-8-ribityllumazine synthase